MRRQRQPRGRDSRPRTLYPLSQDEDPRHRRERIGRIPFATADGLNIWLLCHLTPPPRELGGNVGARRKPTRQSLASYKTAFVGASHRSGAYPSRREAKDLNLYSIDKLCPSCRCGACYPLHRKGIDWALSFWGLRPARCLTCMRKFYARYTLDGVGSRRAAESLATQPAQAVDQAPQDRHRAA